MATSTDLSELEGGDGVWENIQEVLRFGFRDLWKAFAGVDSRVMELTKALTAQKDDSQRQQQHLEALAKTLNVMSEQLRLSQDEAANQQIETRLQTLEFQLHDQLLKDRSSVLDDNMASKASIAKVERRMCLLEEEMEHVVTAIDQKADAETLAEQTKRLQESIRQRCKKEAFDEEVLGIQNRLLQYRQDLETQLSSSFLDLKSTQETLLRSEMASWAAKTQENTIRSVQPTLDQVTQHQTETLRAMDIQMQRYCEDLRAQKKQMGDFQADIEKKVGLTIAADREDIARQCSEAHGRIDYQFRTQEEALEGIRRVLEEEMATSTSERAKQTGAEIAAAVEALDRRVADREHHEIEKLHDQLTEEAQNLVGSALKALEPARDKEQRRLKQHQHLVVRKLAELDQMMQLIGRQLIQNTSQLHVVRNEHLVQNFHLDDESDFDDNDLLLQYESVAQNTVLAEVAPVSGLQQVVQFEPGNDQVAATAQEETAEIQARRSQHQDLQEQLDKKLRDYSQILDSNQQQTADGEEKMT